MIEALWNQIALKDKQFLGFTTSIHSTKPVENFEKVVSNNVPFTPAGWLEQVLITKSLTDSKRIIEDFKTKKGAFMLRYDGGNYESFYQLIMTINKAACTVTEELRFPTLQGL